MSSYYRSLAYKPSALFFAAYLIAFLKLFGISFSNMLDFISSLQVSHRNPHCGSQVLKVFFGVVFWGKNFKRNTVMCWVKAKKLNSQDRTVLSIYIYKHYCFHSFSSKVPLLFLKVYLFAHDLDSTTSYLSSHLDLLTFSTLDSQHMFSIGYFLSAHVLTVP